MGGTAEAARIVESGDVRDGEVYYVGDAAIDQRRWLDTFSRDLTGEPVRVGAVRDHPHDFAHLGPIAKKLRQVLERAATPRKEKANGETVRV